MVAVQTAYTANIQPGVEGQIASMFEDDDVISCLVETAAGIGFGRAVSEGANARGILLGGATKFIGITVKDITIVPPAGVTYDLYPQRATAGVMVSGDVWVRPVAGVSHGAPATYDGTTGQLNPAAAGIAIPGSRYLTTALAGQLACLRLTTPGPGA